MPCMPSVWTLLPLIGVPSSSTSASSLARPSNLDAHSFRHTAKRVYGAHKMHETKSGVHMRHLFKLFKLSSYPNALS